MMSWRVAFVPRPRSSIISISLPWPMRDGGWVSFASAHGFGRGPALVGRLGAGRQRNGVALGERQLLALLDLRDLLVLRAPVWIDREEARARPARCRARSRSRSRPRCRRASTRTPTGRRTSRGSGARPARRSCGGRRRAARSGRAPASGRSAGGRWSPSCRASARAVSRAASGAASLNAGTCEIDCSSSRTGSDFG